MDNKNLSFENLENLSKKYNIKLQDVIFIYLNISGISAETTFPRLRMQIRPLESVETFYFGLANRPGSPFKLKDGYIYLSGREVAKIENIENDDCASSYFRKNKTVVTLNTNRRSSCAGCKFCPNNLELNSEDLNLDNEEKLKNHFQKLMKSVNKENLSFLERITICTGCFNSEQRAVEHLKLVYNVARDLKFNGLFHYIGSEVQSEEAMSEISNNIPNFMYTFTIECFSKRDKILRINKAQITLEQYRKYMALARKMNFIVNYIYILGLDDLDVVLKNINKLKDDVTYFPSINLFQPHTEKHNELISADAIKNLEYYLIARKEFENIYAPKGLKPHSWECYRPLWYFSFNSEDMNDIRI